MRYEDFLEAANKAKANRLGFFERVFGGYCRCLCGGVIKETPDRRTKDGGTIFGGYKCTNNGELCHIPPNSSWHGRSAEDQANAAYSAYRSKKLREDFAKRRKEKL
jgi:hypothetical protein